MKVIWTLPRNVRPLVDPPSLEHIGWFGARILIWSSRVVWRAQFSLVQTQEVRVPSSHLIDQELGQGQH